LSGDEAAAAQVRQALHHDPFFYDRHVQVLARDGTIVLEGFVMSAWDLTDAIRIARRAAGNYRVVDDLELEVGGRQ
jgi:osmotically-inducible protein OsmY